MSDHVTLKSLHYGSFIKKCTARAEKQNRGNFVGTHKGDDWRASVAEMRASLKKSRYRLKVRAVRTFHSENEEA